MEPLKWSVIRSLIDHKLFSRLYIWMIILPALSSLLKKIPEKVSFSISGVPEIVLVTKLPFSWFLLYCAAFSMFISFLIYSWRCPSFLRKFRNAGDAIREGQTSQTIRQEQISFIETYYDEKWEVKGKERVALRALFDQLRASQISFESCLPNPSGERLGELLSEVNIGTAGDGRYYVLDDGTRVEREQFIKHIYNDLIRLLETSFPKMRYLLTGLILMAGLLFTAVVLQGAFSVVSTIVDH